MHEEHRKMGFLYDDNFVIFLVALTWWATRAEGYCKWVASRNANEDKYSSES